MTNKDLFDLQGIFMMMSNTQVEDGDFAMEVVEFEHQLSKAIDKVRAGVKKYVLIDEKFNDIEKAIQSIMVMSCTDDEKNDKLAKLKKKFTKSDIDSYNETQIKINEFLSINNKVKLPVLNRKKLSQYLPKKLKLNQYKLIYNVSK